MFKRKFKTQKEACLFYKHSWKYLEKHYKITRCYDNSGFKGYFFDVK